MTNQLPPKMSASILFACVWLLFSSSAKSANMVQSKHHLLFFEVTKDEAAYNKHPTHYDRIDHLYRKGEVYVGKVLLAKIPAAQVESVVLQREKLLPDPTNPIHLPKKDTVPDYVYVGTFTLDPQGARTMKALTSTYTGKLILMRLDEQALALGPIHEPIKGGEFTVQLSGGNVDHLEQLLSPLKDKITWK